MTAPCESDPAVLAAELEAAWAAYAEMKELAERRSREATGYRCLHFRHLPVIRAFERIGQFACEASQGMPMARVIGNIELEIAIARRERDKILKAQQEAP